MTQDHRTQKRITGDVGEDYVAARLQEEGYMILCRNFAAPPVGEIDLIAQKGNFLAFVEVKTRVEDAMLAPILSVTKAKQQKIVKTALVYLQKLGNNGLQPRFDVAEVTVDPNDFQKVTGYRHWKNVFWPDKNARFF